MTAGVVDKGAFIDEAAIDDALRAAATKDAGRVREILAKARRARTAWTWTRSPCSAR